MAKKKDSPPRPPWQPKYHALTAMDCAQILRPEVLQEAVRQVASPDEFLGYSRTLILARFDQTSAPKQ